MPPSARRRQRGESRPVDTLNSGITATVLRDRGRRNPEDVDASEACHPVVLVESIRDDDIQKLPGFPQYRDDEHLMILEVIGRLLLVLRPEPDEIHIHDLGNRCREQSPIEERLPHVTIAQSSEHLHGVVHNKDAAMSIELNFLESFFDGHIRDDNIFL